MSDRKRRYNDTWKKSHFSCLKTSWQQIKRGPLFFTKCLTGWLFEWLLHILSFLSWLLLTSCRWWLSSWEKPRQNDCQFRFGQKERLRCQDTMMRWTGKDKTTETSLLTNTRRCLLREHRIFSFCKECVHQTYSCECQSSCVILFKVTDEQRAVKNNLVTKTMCESSLRVSK